MLARLARLLTRPRWAVTRFTRAHAALLRLSGGRIRRSFVLAGGQPILSLTTTGRRSGQPRSTAVAYLRDGERLVVTAINLGNPRPPAWSLNLATSPRAWVELDGQRLAVRARPAVGEEAERLWRRWIERLPASDSFLRLTGRQVPIIVLERVGE